MKYDFSYVHFELVLFLCMKKESVQLLYRNVTFISFDPLREKNAVDKKCGLGPLCNLLVRVRYGYGPEDSNCFA